jgi:hypothetical protein
MVVIFVYVLSWLGKAMKLQLFLALLLVSCSALRAAIVEPSVGDNAIYRVGENEAVTMQVEGAGTTPCSSSSPCSGLDIALEDRYNWAPGVSDKRDLAASFDRTSIRAVEVGDLSGFSLYLVERFFKLVAGSAGLTVDDNLKHYDLIVVHDSKAFQRLRTDQSAYSWFGLTDAMISTLRQVSPPDAKCVFSTFPTAENDNVTTVIILSVQFDSCVIRGLFSAFGVRSTADDLTNLMSVCVLYEARRSGVRDRKGLDQNNAAYARACAGKLAGLK